MACREVPTWHGPMLYWWCLTHKHFSFVCEMRGRQ